MKFNGQPNQILPKISVIIPCYNSKTIEKTVESVMRGTYLPHEILIYDDLSNSETRKILHTLSQKYEKIKIYWGDENRGAGYARNYLLQVAVGDYCAFLDADDIWYPRKLEKQLALLLEKNADIVTAAYDIHNQGGEKIGSRNVPRRINYFKMHLANFLPMSFTVINLHLIGARTMPLIRRRQDYAYWLKIIKNNKKLKIYTIREPLGIYRRHGSNLSANPMKNLHANFSVFRKTMGYGIVVSIFFTSLNIVSRLFRS